MLIARNRKTGKYINDFQGHATIRVLQQNAIKSGLSAEDVEILTVTKDEFEMARISYLLDHPPKPDPKEEKIKQDLESATEKLKLLGFTEDEIAVFKYL